MIKVINSIVILIHVGGPLPLSGNWTTLLFFVVVIGHVQWPRPASIIATGGGDVSAMVHQSGR